MKTLGTISRRQFLSTSLAVTGAAAIHGLPVFGQIAPVHPILRRDDLKMAAKQTYLTLKAVFQKSHNYWRLGQTFDTIIDYFLVTNGGEGESALFGPLALERYAATRGSWYDDYAWWSIANLKAAQHRELFGDQTGKFYDNSLDGWNKMAPCTKVWERAQQVPKLEVLKPAVDGGVWNHDYDAADSGNYNPLNPKGDLLGGYQNTVTNALYLVLSARLARHVGPANSSYREAMEREYTFLQSWLTMSRPGFEPLLNVYSGAKDKAVVRERISCYDTGAKLQGYRSNLAWAGDQGLIMGGLVERMELVGKDDPTYPAMLTVVRQILSGVLDYLAVDGLLLPWWPDPPPGYGASRPQGDPDDYRTGIAVYMRYLLCIHRLNNQDLAEPLSAYPDFVSSNVERVMQYPSGVHGKVDFVLGALTNDLAILSIAIALTQK